MHVHVFLLNPSKQVWRDGNRGHISFGSSPLWTPVAAAPTDVAHPYWGPRTSRNPTYSLHCGSFGVLPFGILNVKLVKPRLNRRRNYNGNYR